MVQVKPVASRVEEDVEFFGGDYDSDDSDGEVNQDLMAIATAVEDQIMLAEAAGKQRVKLTSKQKLAVRHKLRSEMRWFVLFQLLLVILLYNRREANSSACLERQSAQHIPRRDASCVLCPPP